jgi:hypothetical protein
MKKWYSCFLFWKKEPEVAQQDFPVSEMDSWSIERQSKTFMHLLLLAEVTLKTSHFKFTKTEREDCALMLKELKADVAEADETGHQ